ncbi:MAG: sugar phosphate isomerase/epimerase [Acidobacteriia bacterium]|nr:sugar phosphate isomerase/epimerase [Terriglobia bacterium]
MRRLLSTHLFASRKLTPEILGMVADAGFGGLEISCIRSHFDFHEEAEIRELGKMLAGRNLTLAGLHAPNNRDSSASREGGSPLSLCEAERVRRIEAMDEYKRAIDVAGILPYGILVLHMGGPRETPDERKRDAAFSSLEHLMLHARHAGVTLAIENTASEMGDSAWLRSFLDETRLTGIRICFDTGHAHLTEGPAEERLAKSFAPLRELVATAHLHDNHGEKDEHLPPYEGTLDWTVAAGLLATAPVQPLPLVLELKENIGPEAPPLAAQLEAGRRAMDRLEETLQEARQAR